MRFAKIYYINIDEIHRDCRVELFRIISSGRRRFSTGLLSCPEPGTTIGKDFKNAILSSFEPVDIQDLMKADEIHIVF